MVERLNVYIYIYMKECNFDDSWEVTENDLKREERKESLKCTIIR